MPLEETKRLGVNIKPLQKGFDPRRNITGQNRKALSKLAAEGYKKKEILDTYAVMLSLTMAELQGIWESEEFTNLERIVAKSLKVAFDTGDLRNPESILARLLGAPKQAVDTNVNHRGKPAWLGQIARIDGLKPTEEASNESAGI